MSGGWFIDVYKQRLDRKPSEVYGPYRTESEATTAREAIVGALRKQGSEAVVTLPICQRKAPGGRERDPSDGTREHDPLLDGQVGPSDWHGDD